MGIVYYLIIILLGAILLDMGFVWSWRRYNRQQQRHVPWWVFLRSMIQSKISDNRMLVLALMMCAVLAAAASQYFFGVGEPAYQFALIAFGLAFPLTWAFAFVERRSPELCALEKPEPPLEAGSPLNWGLLTAEPWRTFFGTIAALALLISSTIAPEPSNNWQAIGLWAVSVISFLIACLPSEAVARRDWKAFVRDHWRPAAIVAGVFVVAAIPRLYGIDSYPIEQDETNLARDARSLQEGTPPTYVFGIVSFAEHPAMFGYVQIASMDIFGFNPVGLKIPSVLLGCLTVVFAFLLLRDMFGRGLAIVGTTLMVFSLYLVYYSRSGTYDMITVLLPLVAFQYFIYRAVHTRQAWHYALAGVTFGLGLWVVYNNISMILIPIVGGTLVYLIGLHLRYWKTEFPKLAILVAGLVVVMLPVWSEAARDNRLMGDVSRGRWVLSEGNYEAMLEVYQIKSTGLTAQVELMVHQVEHSVFGINYYRERSHLAIGGWQPMLDQLTSVFFILGLAYCFWRWRDTRYGLILLAWGAALQVSIWSTSPPLGHRIAPAVLPTYMIAAIGMYKIGSVWAKALNWPQMFRLAAAVGVLGYVSYINLGLTFSPASYPPSWSELKQTGLAIKDWADDHDIYYFGRPWQDSRHGIIEFYSLETSLQAVDINAPADLLPWKQPVQRSVAFIFTPGNYPFLEEIRNAIPGGEVKEWFDYRGNSLLQAYLVTKDQANAANSLSSPP